MCSSDGGMYQRRTVQSVKIFAQRFGMEDSSGKSRGFSRREEEIFALLLRFTLDFHAYLRHTEILQFSEHYYLTRITSTMLTCFHMLTKLPVLPRIATRASVKLDYHASSRAVDLTNATTKWTNQLHLERKRSNSRLALDGFFNLQPRQLCYISALFLRDLL